MRKFIDSVAGKTKGAYKKVAGAITATSIVAYSAVASAAPTTGNTDIDTVLTELEGGFGTANKAFVYLAIAAVPVTLIVVLFFWLRGKFKQAVAGA